MSTANAELRRPTGVGCSELLGGWFFFMQSISVYRGLLLAMMGKSVMTQHQYRGLNPFGDRSPIPQTQHDQEDSAKHSPADRKSTRLNSSHANISYAVFCLKK